MVKRALCGVAAVVAFATVGAVTGNAVVARASAAAPSTRAKARTILRADVTKIARDFSHKRYRAVCVDMTKLERTRLGGMTTCRLKIALIHLLVPIKKFTITRTKFSRGRTQAAVSLYINGNKRHRIDAVAKWEGGRYRLDHESGWTPQI